MRLMIEKQKLDQEEKMKAAREQVAQLEESKDEVPTGDD